MFGSLGYIRTILDSYSAGTKTKLDMASVYT